MTASTISIPVNIILLFLPTVETSVYYYSNTTVYPDIGYINCSKIDIIHISDISDILPLKKSAALMSHAHDAYTHAYVPRCCVAYVLLALSFPT